MRGGGLRCSDPDKHQGKQAHPMAFEWSQYRCQDAYDELFAQPGEPRVAAQRLLGYLQSISPKDLADRKSVV